MTLLGANATANPTNDGSRTAETIIEPAISGPSPYSGTHSFLVQLLSSGVTIEGFTLTGQNDSLGTSNGVALTGTSTVHAQAVEGIASFNPTGIGNISLYPNIPTYASIGNITIKNNVIEDLSYQGVDIGWGSNAAATSGNTISQNVFRNIGAYDDEGDGVRVYNNFFADVAGNQMLNVRMGVEAGNFGAANPGSTGSIASNEIQARRRGVFYNLFHPGVSAIPVTSNTITATADDPAYTGSLWTGVYIISQEPGVTGTFENNVIDGTGSSHTPTAGFTVLSTSSTAAVTISGGTISGVNYGIWEDTGQPNGFGATAGGMAVTISGVAITASTYGVYIHEDPGYAYDVTATIEGDTTIAASGSSVTGIEVSGAKASVAFSGTLPVALDGGLSDYIVLAGGAMGGATPGTLDASQASFGGFIGGDASPINPADFYAVEDKINDYLDNPALGSISLNPNNVFVTQESETSTAGAVQRGVNVASTGGHLYIQAGSFDDQVTIGQDLSVTGAGPGQTTIFAPATMAPDSYGKRNVVEINNGASVTMTGLTVSGPGSGTSGSIDTGIAVLGGANLDLSAAAVVDISDNPLSGAQNGEGIRVGQPRNTTTPATWGTATITNVTVSGYQKNGIVFAGAGTTGTIQNDTITGVGLTNTIAQNGIQIGDGATATVEDNIVSGNEYNGPFGGASPLVTQSIGILIFDAGSGVTITGNTVKGNDLGIYTYSSSPSDVAIDGNLLNTATPNRYEGILVDQGNATLTNNAVVGGQIGVLVMAYAGNTSGSVATLGAGNTITGAAVAGVQMLQQTGATQEPVLTIQAGNTITGNAIGVDAQAGTATIDGGVAPITAIAGNTIGVEFAAGTGEYTGTGGGSIDGVSFVGTTVGTTDNTTDVTIGAGAGTVTLGAATPNTFAAATTFINNQSSQGIDASNNSFSGYFGGELAKDASPTTDLADFYAVVDRITDRLDSPAFGYVNLNTGNFFVTPGKESSDAGAIQRAIDLTSSGGTVHVQAGTFQEGPITVDQGITLTGAGAGSTFIKPPVGLTGGEIIISGPAAVAISDMTVDAPNDPIGILVDGTTSTISGMVVTGYDTGIQITNGGNGMIGGSTVDGNTIGVQIINASHATIINTDLTSNSVGIQLGNVASDTSSVIATLDTLTGDGVGVLNHETGVQASARDDWWGNEYGPSIASNPGGTGVPDAGNVLITPWIGVYTPSSASPGFYPTISAYYAVPTQLVVATQPSSSVPYNTPFGTQPVFKAEDANGYLGINFDSSRVPGSQVNLTLNSLNGGIATLQGTNPVSAADGYATFADLSIGGIKAPGYDYTLTAAGLPGVWSGLTQATTEQFHVTQTSTSFSGLSSQTIAYGTSSIGLSGRLVAPGSIPAGETITITINGAADTVSLSSNGTFSTTFDTATIPASATPYAITYDYPGDANYSSATDNSTALTVDQALPVFSNLTPSQPIPYGTGTVTVSGDLTSPTAIPAGDHVTVTIDGFSGTGTVQSNGGFTATIDTATIAAATTPYPIGYSFAATVNFAAASDSSTALTVNKAVPAFSNLSASTSITYGQNTVDFSGDLASPTGSPVSSSVIVAVGGYQGTGTVDASGHFTATVSTATIPASGSPYTVAYLFAGSGNFASALDTSTTLTVDQAAPTFSGLSSQAITYGQGSVTVTGALTNTVTSALPVGQHVSVSIDGFSGTGTVDAAGVFSATIPTGTLAVASYPIVYAYAGTENFRPVSDQTTTLKVDQAPLKFTGMSDQTIPYGTSTLTVTGELVNTATPALPLGETVKVTIDGSSAIGVVELGGGFIVTVPTGTIPYQSGGYTITYSYAGDTNFQAASDTSTTLTVNRAPLRIRAGNRGTGYGGGNNFNGYTVTGLVNQDAVSSVTLTTDAPSSTSGNWDAGTWTITPTNAQGTGLGNYDIAYDTGTLDITEATLVVTAAASNKVYNGNKSAAVTLSDNRISGDVVTDSFASATFSDKNAGTGKAVTVSGVGISGADAANYVVASTTVTAAANIDPAPATASLIGSVGKVYDGTSNAPLAAGNYQLGGIESGDTVSLNDPTAGTFSGKNVGTGLTVTVAGLGLSGADAGNYALASTTASAPIGTITQATATVALVGSVVKVYDGTPAASLGAGNYQLGGIVSGDTVTLNDPAIGVYGGKDAGTGRNVAVAGLALSGADASDYTLASSTVSAPIGVITPASLTITADNRAMIAGTVVPPLTASYSGFVGGDTPSSLTTPAALSTTATPASPAGVYPILVSGATSPDYTITFLPGQITASQLTSSTVMVTTSGSSVFSQAVSLTAVVAAASPGGPTPTGSVSFLVDGRMIGTAGVNGSGLATLDTTEIPLGSQTVVATYTGNLTYPASQSGPITWQVNPAGTTTRLSLSPVRNARGKLVSVILTSNVGVMASGTAIPGGSVGFFRGNGLLMGFSTLSDGKASFKLPASYAMGKKFWAKYGGETTMLGSKSGNVPVNRKTLKAATPQVHHANAIVASQASHGYGTDPVQVQAPANVLSRVLGFIGRHTHRKGR